MKIIGQTTLFLKAEAERRLQNSPLMKLNDLVSWGDIGVILGKMDRFGYGPQAYPPLSLFKALILQAWHSLSDPGLEEALRVHLDFMTFTGFDRDIPDETTFCRFRGLLNTRGLWAKLLAEINRQLQSQNTSRSNQLKPLSLTQLLLALPQDRVKHMRVLRKAGRFMFRIIPNFQQIRRPNGLRRARCAPLVIKVLPL